MLGREWWPKNLKRELKKILLKKENPKTIVKKNVFPIKNNIFGSMAFDKLKLNFVLLKQIKNEIKYWIKINIPDILTDNKNAVSVDNTNKEKKEILFFLI